MLDLWGYTIKFNQSYNKFITERRINMFFYKHSEKFDGPAKDEFEPYPR